MSKQNQQRVRRNQGQPDTPARPVDEKDWQAALRRVAGDPSLRESVQKLIEEAEDTRARQGTGRQIVTADEPALEAEAEVTPGDPDEFIDQLARQAAKDPLEGDPDAALAELEQRALADLAAAEQDGDDLSWLDDIAAETRPAVSVLNGQVAGETKSTVVRLMLGEIPLIFIVPGALQVSEALHVSTGQIVELEGRGQLLTGETNDAGLAEIIDLLTGASRSVPPEAVSLPTYVYKDLRLSAAAFRDGTSALVLDLRGEV